MSSETDSFSGSPFPFERDGAFVSGPQSFLDYEAPTPDMLEARAVDRLKESLEGDEGALVTDSACGTVGVQADQTHYSDGFALLMPLQQYVAVAVHPADADLVLGAQHDEEWTVMSEQRPTWARAIHEILQSILQDQSVTVSVASAVPATCRDGALAALAVAVVRALRALDVQTAVDLESVQALRDEVVPLLADAVSSAVERPYSSAYLLASFAGREPAFTLVDTATREHLPVETDARDELCWAVFDPGAPASDSVRFHRQRQEQAMTALHQLRGQGFDGLRAFRDLNYQDLESALDLLSDELRPIVRHLVTENHRVQKHVAAMRRRDWQMIGGLLLMSHASRRDQWKGTSPAADALVSATETRTHNGLYGACMTGRSGAVLVVGRRQNFESGLHHLSEAVTPIMGQSPRILAP